MSGRTLQSIEDIKIQIRETSGNPNIGKVHHLELKEGPRAYRIATVFEILNGETGELHHHALKLDAYEKSGNGFVKKTARSDWITSEPGELDKLGGFINSVLGGHLPNEAGDYFIVNDEAYQRTEFLKTVIGQAEIDDKLGLLQELLNDIVAAEQKGLDQLASANDDLLNNVAIAARMTRYRRVYEDFRKLIDREDTSESAIQTILSENPWLFGSEYSELLERRTWTRDDRLDFMLRRAVDGYLEIIEIKKPFNDALLLYDSSHDSYYPSASLSKVIGQVMRYIEEIERKRDSIVAQDGSDPLKIRARIIVGRDGDSNHQGALRNLNAHLYRIEILTFDQLLRIGDRVLNVFQDNIGVVSTDAGETLQEEDDIPF